MSAYRHRFALAHDPLPRDASGKNCFLETPEFEKLRRVFNWLAAEPGLGVLTAEAGLGKGRGSPWATGSSVISTT